MSEQEIRNFVSANNVLLLSSLNEDESPSADVARYVVDDGHIVFSLPRDGRSATNIRRDSRTCAIVETYPSYYEIKAAIIHGNAREEPHAPGCGDRNAGETDEEVQSLFCMALDTSKVISFNFAKIQHRMFDAEGVKGA
jgi:nitroimidazol reductase NimA-like FMN-containing flavoprotein (pyridoxamine 5'-phosphate oxidase superfamily)